MIASGCMDKPADLTFLQHYLPVETAGGSRFTIRVSIGRTFTRPTQDAKYVTMLFRVRYGRLW